MTDNFEFHSSEIAHKEEVISSLSDVLWVKAGKCYLASSLSNKCF